MNNTVMRTKLFIFVLCLTLLQVGKAYSQSPLDFSSPEATLKTYFGNYNDRDKLSRCFHPPGFTGSLERWWIEYEIVSSKKTGKAGTTTHSGMLIKRDAVEVITEVKMKHSAKDNPKTKFWYLVQKVDDEWKILEHSHLPDKNYPPHD